MGVFVIIGIVLTTTIFRAIGECIPKQQGLLCSCYPTKLPSSVHWLPPNSTSPRFHLSHRLSMKSALQSAAPYCAQTPHLLPSSVLLLQQTASSLQRLCIIKAMPLLLDRQQGV